MHVIRHVRQLTALSREHRLCRVTGGPEAGANLEAQNTTAFSVEGSRGQRINQADKFSQSMGAIANFVERCAKFVGNFLQELGKAFPGLQSLASVPFIPIPGAARREVPPANQRPGGENTRDIPADISKLQSSIDANQKSMKLLAARQRTLAGNVAINDDGSNFEDVQKANAEMQQVLGQMGKLRDTIQRDGKRVAELRQEQATKTAQIPAATPSETQAESPVNIQTPQEPINASATPPNQPVTVEQQVLNTAAPVVSNTVSSAPVNAEPALKASVPAEPRAAREVVAERMQRGGNFLESFDFTKGPDGVWSATNFPWKFKADGNGRWLTQQTAAGQWESVDSVNAPSDNPRIADLLQRLKQSSDMTPEHIQTVLRARRGQELQREGGVWLLQQGCTPYTGTGGGFEYSTGFLSFNLNPQFQFVAGKWAARWRTSGEWNDPATVQAPSGRGAVAINAILDHLASLNTQIDNAGTLHDQPQDAPTAHPASPVNLMPPVQQEPERPQATEQEKQGVATFVGNNVRTTIMAAEQYQKNGNTPNLLNVIQCTQEEIIGLRSAIATFRDEPGPVKMLSARLAECERGLKRLQPAVESLAKTADDNLARARQRVNEVIGREQQAIISENAGRESGNNWFRFGTFHRWLTNSDPYEIQITNAHMNISRMRPLVEQLDKAASQPDALAKIRATETAFAIIRNANRSDANANQELYKLEQEAITVTRDVSIAIATTVATLGTSAAFSLAARGTTAAANAANTGATATLSMLRQATVQIGRKVGEDALKAIIPAIGVAIDEMRTKAQGGTIDPNDRAVIAKSIAGKIGWSAAFGPLGDRAAPLVQQTVENLTEMYQNAQKVKVQQGEKKNEVQIAEQNQKGEKLTAQPQNNAPEQRVELSPTGLVNRIRGLANGTAVLPSLIGNYRMGSLNVDVTPQGIQINGRRLIVEAGIPRARLDLSTMKRCEVPRSIIPPSAAGEGVSVGTPPNEQKVKFETVATQLEQAMKTFQGNATEHTAAFGLAVMRLEGPPPTTT